MKKIAIITGASSGIGKEFALKLNTYDNFDEVWVIARNLDKLNELKGQIPFPIKPISLDLSKMESIEQFSQILKEENPCVSLLINCSGYGKFQKSTHSIDDSMNMVDLICKALMGLCLNSIPYMIKGSKIINIASVAAYQPIPYINVYAATKTFVMYFSRALNSELKSDGIGVMAVCPFWTKTAFFDRAVLDGEPIVKKYVAMYNPEDIVKRAYKDLKRGKDVSMFGFKAKAQTLLVKLLPHSLVMKIWKKQQKLK